MVDRGFDTLIAAVERFNSANEEGPDPEVRWLTGQLKEVRAFLMRVQVGELTPDEQRAVGEFRLKEIAYARHGYADQVARLDAEAASLRAAMAPPDHVELIDPPPGEPALVTRRLAELAQPEPAPAPPDRRTDETFTAEELARDVPF
jgi:hypothetical protein